MVVKNPPVRVDPWGEVKCKEYPAALPFHFAVPKNVLLHDWNRVSLYVFFIAKNARESHLSSPFFFGGGYALVNYSIRKSRFRI